MADKPKQKNVRISDPELFNECRELLKNEFGETLTDSQVVQSGLCWLKLGRTQKLIPVTEAAEQAKRGFLPHISAALAEVLNVLMDAELLKVGEYIVEGNPETLQIRLLKDGEIVQPVKPDTQDDSNIPPDWLSECLPEKKQAVN